MRTINLEHLKILENIGLSSAEARVYLSCLILGPSSVIQISQKANFTRQMIYTLIPSLKEKGLIKETKIGEKTYYEATNPDFLKDLLLKTGSKIEKLIPELKSSQATASAIPLITVYENPIAMREWYKNFMKQAKKKDELLVWSAGRDWYNLDLKFYRKWIRFKDKLGMKNLILTSDITENKKKFWKQAIFHNAKFKYLKKWWNTKTEKWIWRDQVCYLTMRENATNMIVIKSKDLATLERFDFYKIWKSIK
jgi:sugar-specific transcriptional regulator TrmB